MYLEASTNHSCYSSHPQPSSMFPFPPPLAPCAPAPDQTAEDTHRETKCTFHVMCSKGRSNTTPRAILHGRLGSCLKEAWHELKEVSRRTRPMNFALNCRHSRKSGHWIEWVGSCLLPGFLFTIRHIHTLQTAMPLRSEWHSWFTIPSST